MRPDFKKFRFLTDSSRYFNNDGIAGQVEFYIVQNSCNTRNYQQTVLSSPKYIQLLTNTYIPGTLAGYIIYCLIQSIIYKQF